MAKILIVDDDDAFRKVLRLLLERRGHNVVEATDGRRAWGAYQANQPVELVIMDLIMPDKEGLETIQMFRRNKAPVKILAVSGGGRVDARDILRVAEQFGADKALAKPFSADDLGGVLKELLPADA